MRVCVLALCLAALACAGCLTSSSVSCEAGRVCPAGSVCDDVHGGCAYPDQISQCAGVPERAPCSYAGVPDGACFEGVCLAAGCGNGTVNAPEVCDDGNRLHGDGCSADCLSNETCGNGFVDVVKGEACDDGNRIDGDGCQANCTRPTCGDGVLDTDRMEQCDEGAANSDAPDAACRTTCQPRRCGDGVVDTGEVCDDGNVSSGDGCSGNCQSHESCGNGIIDLAANELCDDGNNTNGDGCQANCKIARCGDGVVDANLFEQCDAGAANADVADAPCRTNCRAKRCGDNIVDSNEVCDDGNLAPHDGCTPDCLSNETCGNRYTDVLEGEVCDDGDQQNHDGCNRCEAEHAAWQRALPGTPLARRGAALAYDPARRRLVMFGGLLAGVYFGDTWEWDGATWTDVTPSGISPPSRAYGRLAYDTARHVTVLFAGDNSSAGRYADTWEWNGSVWVDRSPPAPIPPTQHSHVLAYDSVRHRVVLFVGYGGAASETWEYDGTAWTKKALSGPVPTLRYGAMFAFDAARGRLVLFGGREFFTSTLLADTWEWNGTAWTNVTPASGNPPPRYFAAAAYDASRRRVVMTAGIYDSGYLADTWEWDGTSWTDVTPAAGSPPGRYDHAFAYDGNNRVVTFGGVDNVTGESAATLSWDGAAWTDLSATVTPPPARTDHAAAYDAARGKIVLFGGESGSALGDTWEWNGTRWTNATPASGNPAARRDHALAYDAIKRRVLLFGGFASSTADVADTWEWNGTAWTDVTPGSGSPAARQGHALAYDATRKRAVLFGGAHAGSAFGDTWEWNGSTWSNVTPASGNPPARRDAALAFDASRSRVVLFGGVASNGTYFSDTWEWNGTAWTQVSQAAGSAVPPSRAKHALAYDASRARVVLFSGSNTASGTLDDTWEWNGSEWKLVTSSTTGPSAREGVALAYDVARSELVAFGGHDGTTSLSDTWTWRYTSADLDERCIGGLDGDGDGLRGCADPDCFGYCSPLCNPTAMTCDPAWPRCGDGTCQGVETARLCPADCGAPLAVCGDAQCDVSESSSSCPGDCP